VPPSRSEESRRFSWTPVLSTAPLGLVFAALTITGSIRGVEATKWVALSLLTIVGVIVALRCPRCPFRHGLAAGFLAGLAAIWTQALFIATYFANNPGYAGLEMPVGLTARQATFLLGPLNALLAGLVVGTLAWFIRKILSKR